MNDASVQRLSIQVDSTTTASHRNAAAGCWFFANSHPESLPPAAGESHPRPRRGFSHRRSLFSLFTRGAAAFSPVYHPPGGRDNFCFAVCDCKMAKRKAPELPPEHFFYTSLTSCGGGRRARPEPAGSALPWQARGWSLPPAGIPCRLPGHRPAGWSR